MSVTFERVTTKEQIAMLCTMAKRIWVEHYTPILGQAQVEYMVEKFQSESAVTEQIANGGYEYYFALYQGKRAGFIGIVPEDNALFLSKLYIDADFRRKGIAAAALAFLNEYCTRVGLSKIYLTVNRHNAGSIAAYCALGFKVAREQVADIGSGFVMDDYVMERSV